MISALAESGPPRSRRLHFRPRRRVRRHRSGSGAAVGASAHPCRAPDRAAVEPRCRDAALNGADPARSKLCQARPVPGDAAGCGRRRARPRSGAAAGPDAAVSAGASRSGDRRVVRQAGQRDLFAIRSAGRGRLDRAGAPRRSRDHARPQAPSPSKCCGRASSRASTPICTRSPMWRAAPRSYPPRRGGCGLSKWSIPCAAP